MLLREGAEIGCLSDLDSNFESIFFCLPHQNAGTSCCTSTSSKSFLVFYGFLVVTVLKYAKFEAENAHNAFAMSWVPIICFLKVYDLYIGEILYV